MEEMERRELLTATYTFTSLASFLGRTSPTGNGAQPQGLVQAPNGDLYGVAAIGGTKAYGTVFKVPAGTNTIITLATFDGKNGGGPRGNLVLDGDGNLFGITAGGGSTQRGTVWELPAGSGTITSLVSFTGKNGAFPLGGLVMDAQGNLFGTAGGKTNSTNKATVFEIAAGTHAFSVVATLPSSSRPTGSLVIDSAGNIFGTTGRGGKNGRGTVFEVAAGASTATTLVSFNGTNGSGPDGALVLDPDGNVIGTTAGGGGTKGVGTIFKVTPNGANSTLTTLATFGGGNGNRPLGNIILDGAGNLFGVTALGGGNGTGAVWELDAGSHTIAKLFGFKTKQDGLNPTGGLVMDGMGNLIGLTFGGGTEGRGTLFELSPAAGPG